MEKILNVKHFIVGWLRYHLYYSRFYWLIRKHTREQIDVRINSMNEECYLTGSCIKCGCATTALQMASKSCEGYCYPVLVSRKSWKALKNILNSGYVKNNGFLWEIVRKEGKLVFKKL